MKITNLQRLGIDTNLEKKLTINIKGDIKADFQSVFRVLRRLTLQHEFGKEEAEQIIKSLKAWRPSIALDENYDYVDPVDMSTISRLLGFDTRDMTPVTVLSSGTTILCIYDGKPFRSQHVFIGSFRRSATLPSGSVAKDVFLISRQAAIMLNWAQLTYGTDDVVNPSWASAYQARDDMSYFGVLLYFIISKFNAINARHHAEPLRKIFTDFYTDYLATFSVTLQTREESRLNNDSVATAYETKKNIPERIKRRMDETPLRSHFGFVEFDEDIDLDLLDNFESSVESFIQAEPYIADRKVASLRLRKLGKHSSVNKQVTGLYHPQVDNISIDLRDVKSFAHEWGHAFDRGHNNLSSEPDFMDNIYSEVVSEIVRATDIDNSMKAYYAMPTEVFARMFEWFIYQKHNMGTNPCFHTAEDYDQNPIYKVYHSLRREIDTYFSRFY